MKLWILVLSCMVAVLNYVSLQYNENAAPTGVVVYAFIIFSLSMASFIVLIVEFWRSLLHGAKREERTINRREVAAKPDAAAENKQLADASSKPRKRSVIEEMWDTSRANPVHGSSRHLVHKRLSPTLSPASSPATSPTMTPLSSSPESSGSESSDEEWEPNEAPAECTWGTDSTRLPSPAVPEPELPTLYQAFVEEQAVGGTCTFTSMV